MLKKSKIKNYNLLFIYTGQYGSAEYIYPLIENNYKKKEFKFQIFSDSISSKFWKEKKINHTVLGNLKNKNQLKSIFKFKPKKFIISATNNNFIEKSIIDECKKHNVTSISFVDTWSNYSERFTYRKKIYQSNFVLSIDYDSDKELKKINYINKQIIRIGQPYFEKLIKIKKIKGKKIIFISQPIKSLYKNSLGFTENDFFNFFKEYISVYPDKNCIFLKHPSEFFKKNNNKHIKKGAGFKDIINAKVVIGLFSTQLIAGYLLQRKVANYSPKNKIITKCQLSKKKFIPYFNDINKLHQFIISKDLNTFDYNFINSFNGSLNRLISFLHK